MLIRLFLLFLFLTLQAATAAVPDAIQTELKRIYPQAKFRIDNLLQVNDKLWLLFIPKVNNGDPAQPITLSLKTNKEDFLFSNGWIYTPIDNKIVKSFDYYPEAIQRQLLISQISPEFLVPKKFFLPRDLAMTAGRLPLELSNIELATDRELLFKKRLEESKTNDLTFMVFSNQTHKVDMFNLEDFSDPAKKDIFKPAKGAESLNLPDNSFKYVSKVKKIKDSLYIADFHQGKIFKISKPEQQIPDATKPLEKFEENFKYNFEEFLDLKKLGVESKLVDFALSNDDSVIYVLTSAANELLIVHSRDKRLMKTIKIPAVSDELKVLSRSASEPDKVFFRSRAANKLFVLNSFDYNIAAEIDLNKIDPNFLFIPYSYLLFSDQILVTVEAISKDFKNSSTNGAKILVLDVINGSLNKIIDLDFIPYKLIDYDRKVLILGHQPVSYESKLIELNLEDYSFTKAEIALGADFPAVKDFTLDKDSNLILVPSPSTNLLGIVDLKTFTLVKKITTKNPIDFIIKI